MGDDQLGKCRRAARDRDDAGAGFGEGTGDPAPQTAAGSHDKRCVIYQFVHVYLLVSVCLQWLNHRAVPSNAEYWRSKVFAAPLRQL
jgi:hypothetical protein